ncbi:hypothetical protein [Sphingobacterium detergens]|nr:hypothetical protein [Sphingobacterium detergens]
MKRLILISALLLICFNAFTQQEQAKAESAFKNATFISFNTNIKPEQLIGSIIYYKEGKKDEFDYFPILKASQIEKIEPIYNNEILFSTMVNKSTVTSAKYLAIINVNVATNYMLEVIVEDVLDYRAPSFAADSEVQSQALFYARVLKNQGYIVEYVDHVNLCTLTSKVYAEQKIEGQGSYFVDASNKTYGSNDEFSSKRLISLHSVPLTPFVDVFKVSKLTDKLSTSAKSMLNERLSNEALAEKAALETKEPSYEIVDKFKLVPKKDLLNLR